MAEVPNAKEVLKDTAPIFDGEKVSIDAVLNKEITIMDFRTSPSTFHEGDYCAVSFMNGAISQWFTTGSGVLISQLRKLRELEKIPAKATITKVKRYYTMA